MDGDRKPRGDNRLLAPHDELLERWIGQENLTYAQAQARLERDHGLRISISALHRWWRRRGQRKIREVVLRNITAGAEATRQIAGLAERQGVPDLDQLISWVRVLIANLATRPDAKVDVEGLVQLIRPAMEWAKIRQRGEQLEMDREKLELLKRKAAAAEAAEAVAGDTELTPEQKMQRFREIFGLSG